MERGTNNRSRRQRLICTSCEGHGIFWRLKGVGHLLGNRFVGEKGYKEVKKSDDREVVW